MAFFTDATCIFHALCTIVGIPVGPYRYTVFGAFSRADWLSLLASGELSGLVDHEAGGGICHSNGFKRKISTASFGLVSKSQLLD